MIFFVKTSKVYFWKKIIFSNFASYMAAALLQKELFFRHFLSILPTNSVSKIKEHLFWRKSFESEHLQSLLLFISAASQGMGELGVVKVYTV